MKSKSLQVLKDDFLNNEVTIEFHLGKNSCDIKLNKRNKFISNDDILQSLGVNKTSPSKNKNQKEKNIIKLEEKLNDQSQSVEESSTNLSFLTLAPTKKEDSPQLSEIFVQLSDKSKLFVATEINQDPFPQIKFDNNIEEFNKLKMDEE